MLTIKPYGEYKLIPFLHLPISVSSDGRLFDEKGKEISLSDFNELTGLKIKDPLVLLAVSYHQFNWPPAYWSEVKVLQKVEGVIAPETLLIGLDAPVESKEYPGFYMIPYFSNYVISPAGKLIKKSDGEEIQASRTSLGYYTFRMTDDSGRTQNRLRHRILCYAFRPYPSNVEELDVNHKNGVPGDDFLDNLEWATRSENMLHAFQNGLRSDNVEVQARDVETGKIYIFASCSQAGRFFGVTETTISNRAKTNGHRVFGGYQFRFHPNYDDWPKPEENKDARFLVEFPDGTSKRCDSIEAAKLAGVTRTSLMRMLREGRHFGKTQNKVTRLPPA